jgi:Amt family ammonium transporter
MIVATALVLIMTPGLGFFYGGMVGKKMLLVPCYKVLWLMIIVYCFMGCNCLGLSFGPTIGGIIAFHCPIYFFKT